MLLFKIPKLTKISWIVGTKNLSFNLIQCFYPLIGLWKGTKSSFSIFIIRTAIKILISNFSILNLFYHTPSLCGALYFSIENRLYRCAIPAICMFIFIIHPIGSQAYAYSFYWLIPIFITLSNTKSNFLKMLASTFTTHAVGSILWLYRFPMTALYWNSLISIVWAERLTMALSMLIMHEIYIYLSNVNSLACMEKINEH